MSRDEAKLSWIQYVMDNSNGGTTNIEVKTAINMFDFIDEVANELQCIIDSKVKEIEKLKEKECTK